MAGRRRTIQLPAFNGVGLGQTPTLNLPIGDTYHYIMLRAKTTSNNKTYKDIIESIRLKLNGREVQVWDKVEHLTNINKFCMVPEPSGTESFIKLFLDRVNLRTRAGEEMTSLATGDVYGPDGQVLRSPIRTATLEVKIKGSGVAGVELEAFAVVSDAEVFGPLRKIRTFHYPLVAGEITISDLPTLDLIDRITFVTDKITKLRIAADQFIVYERSLALHNEIIKDSDYRQLVPGYTMIDFSEEGFAVEAMPTVDINDLRFYVEASQAVANCPVIVEYIGGLEI